MARLWCPQTRELECTGLTPALSLTLSFSNQFNMNALSFMDNIKVPICSDCANQKYKYIITIMIRTTNKFYYLITLLSLYLKNFLQTVER